MGQHNRGLPVVASSLCQACLSLCFKNRKFTACQFRQDKKYVYALTQSRGQVYREKSYSPWYSFTVQSSLLFQNQNGKSPRLLHVIRFSMFEIYGYSIIIIFHTEHLVCLLLMKISMLSSLLETSHTDESFIITWLSLIRLKIKFFRLPSPPKWEIACTSVKYNMI